MCDVETLSLNLRDVWMFPLVASFSALNLNKHVSSMRTEILVCLDHSYILNTWHIWKLNKNLLNEWIMMMWEHFTMTFSRKSPLFGRWTKNRFLHYKGMIIYHDYLGKTMLSISSFPLWQEPQLRYNFFIAFPTTCRLQNYHMVMHSTDKIHEVWKALTMQTVVSNKGQGCHTTVLHKRLWYHILCDFSVKGKPIYRYIIWAQNLTPFYI